LMILKKNLLDEVTKKILFKKIYEINVVEPSRLWPTR
jgi:hypothetical protein